MERVAATTRPMPRTTPVVTERGRFALPVLSMRPDRTAGQAALVILLGVAFAGIVFAQLGPGGDGRAVASGASPSPAASAAAGPRPPRRDGAVVVVADAGRGQPDAGHHARSDRGSPAPSTSAPATYTVQRGDTLSGIAAEYGTTWQVLAELNDIKNPSALRVGRSWTCPADASPLLTQGWQPRQYEVMNPPALTSVIRVPQRGQGCPPLSWTARKSRTCFSNVGGTRSRRMRRPRQRLARRPIERVDLLGREARPLPEGEQAGRVQDLVAVGVADPGHERLVPEQVLELARMALDPFSPDVERQVRAVRVGTLLVCAEAGDRSLDAGRAQVDLAHLGLVAVADLGGCGIGRQPRRSVGPAAASGGPARRGPKPQTTAVFDGSAAPGGASCRRPVSIGLMAIASRSRSISRNLPRRRIARTPGRPSPQLRPACRGPPRGPASSSTRSIVR